MTYVEKLKQAKNAREAALILAEGLDALVIQVEDVEVRLAEPDSWDQWESSSEPHAGAASSDRREGSRTSETTPSSATPSDPGLVRIFDPFVGAVRDVPLAELDELRELAREGLKAALKGGDKEDIESAQAAMRLLNETGEPPAETPRGRMTKVTIDHNDVTVEIPVVDAERKEARASWAQKRVIWTHLEPTLGDQEAVDAYASGGPVWLYNYDRKAVKEMPLPWRQELILELEKDSPAEAQEMARDLLMADADDTVPGKIGEGW